MKGEELFREMKTSGVLEHMVMLFGQMNEPPQSFSLAQASVIWLNIVRDQEINDVLLLIDNIFRFKFKRESEVPQALNGANAPQEIGPISLLW